jgi:hypothetical protein
MEIQIRVGDTFANSHGNVTEVMNIHSSGKRARLEVSTSTVYHADIIDIKHRIADGTYINYKPIKEHLKYDDLEEGSWYKLLCSDGKGVYGKFKSSPYVNTRDGQTFLWRDSTCRVTNKDYHHVIAALTQKEIDWVKYCDKNNIRVTTVGLELLVTKFNNPIKTSKDEVHRQITEQGEPRRKGTRAIREKIKIASAIRPVGGRITNLRRRGSVRRTTIKRNRLFTD